MDAYDRDFLQAGIYAIPPSLGVSGVHLTPTANRGYLVRFAATRQISLVNVVVGVNTAATNNDSCDAAILNEDGSVLASNGGVAGKMNGTGAQAIPVAATLEPHKVYYAMFSYGAIGGTAATLAALGLIDNQAPILFGSTLGKVEMAFQNTVFPIGAGPITISAQTTLAPLMALREF